MLDRLLLAVFRLEMTTSLAAAGDFACPPPTRPRRPTQLPLACTCAARSPVVHPLAPRPALRRASVQSVRRDRSVGRPRPATRSCWSLFYLQTFWRTLRTVLGRLRLADVDTSSGTMDANKFLPSSLATGTTYFFPSGKATRPIRMANAPIPPPDPNCRAGPP